MENKKYNVYIVRDKDSKAISLIGENLSEEKAEKREETGLGRIDPLNYSVFGDVLVGSDLDKKYKEDLKQKE